MKKAIALIFIIIFISFFVYQERKKHNEKIKKDIIGQVDSTYKVNKKTLTIIKESHTTINEKKLLILYSQYQQGIFFVFDDYKKSRDYSLSHRFTLFCADLLFSKNSEVLDKIFESIFDNKERMQAQKLYIHNLKGQKYENLLKTPETQKKCENLY